MAIGKGEILDEIRRCAEGNGGVALGKIRFEAETGIKESDWRGRHWVTWSDAIAEAGFAPNSMQARNLDDDGMVRKLAELTRKLGRFPTVSQLQFERRSDSTFPMPTTVAKRFGNKAEQIKRVVAFAAANSDFADVNEMLAVDRADDEPAENDEPVEAQVNGVVYLIKSGRYHKIGRSNDLGRRSYEIALQLPDKAVLVHSIETDDPAGIESYWHRRFADRRQNGEWFALTAADVAAFKRRRRFM